MKNLTLSLLALALTSSAFAADRSVTCDIKSMEGDKVLKSYPKLPFEKGDFGTLATFEHKVKADSATVILRADAAHEKLEALITAKTKGTFHKVHVNGTGRSFDITIGNAFRGGLFDYPKGGIRFSCQLD